MSRWLFIPAMAHEYEQFSCLSPGWLKAFPFKPMWLIVAQPLLSILGYLLLNAFFWASSTLQQRGSKLFHRFFPDKTPPDAKEALEDLADALTIHQLSQVAHTLYQIGSSLLVYILAVYDAAESQSCNDSWNGYLLFLLQLSNSGFFESYAASFFTAWFVQSNGQTMMSSPQWVFQLILILPLFPLVAASVFVFPLVFACFLLIGPILWYAHKSSWLEHPTLKYMLITIVSHVIAFCYAMIISYFVLFLNGTRWEDTWEQDWWLRDDHAWFKAHRAWAHIANLI